jgi:hypothetical protein
MLIDTLDAYTAARKQKRQRVEPGAQIEHPVARLQSLEPACDPRIFQGAGEMLGIKAEDYARKICETAQQVRAVGKCGGVIEVVGAHVIGMRTRKDVLLSRPRYMATSLASWIA